MVCTFCSDAECAHHFFFTGACMSLTPTDEQSAIIHWQGQKLVVNAFAGTGKTSTLVQYALANPDSRMLYLPEAVPVVIPGPVPALGHHSV